MTYIKPGKKAARNKKINRDLKSNAVTRELPKTCELHLPGCKGSEPPTDWAHSHRRRKWANRPELHLRAAMACRVCHNKADALGEEENDKIILGAIERRETNWFEPA